MTLSNPNRALKPCPCGKPVERLYMTEGSTFRWRYVEGCGCGWMIETRIDTMRPKDSAVDYQECVEAWNEMPRASVGDRLND